MGTVHKFQGQPGEHYEWEGQRTQDYSQQPGILPGTVLQWLVGKAESAPTFAIRYFEIPPGGTSTPEQHPYEHGIIVVRGQATVVLGEAHSETNLDPMDVAFIPPDEFHQFQNRGKEVFGAFCIIPAYRQKGDQVVYAEGSLKPDPPDGA